MRGKRQQYEICVEPVYAVRYVVGFTSSAGFIVALSFVVSNVFRDFVFTLSRHIGSADNDLNVLPCFVVVNHHIREELQPDGESFHERGARCDLNWVKFKGLATLGGLRLCIVAAKLLLHCLEDDVIVLAVSGAPEAAFTLLHDLRSGSDTINGQVEQLPGTYDLHQAVDVLEDQHEDVFLATDALA
ncbi:peptide ABC transporter permease, putative [Babesia ovata]|uniref:Peptide ABC transporter permease, putative n=1 Tax=Babesia ovata TaxID=189622 RepID=A0A2H6KCV3_9APIC|nr:peptide ABC transporter permease, putative [Babesia ovata]GBE60830.1 peptide ABC transporter permease, putative [Babesia ovata]